MAGAKSFSIPNVVREGIVLASDYISSSDLLRVHIQNKRPDLDSIHMVILKDAQIVYFNKMPCRLPSFLFKVELPSNPGTLNIFILDKKYQILAEKTQVIDTLGSNFFIDAKRSFTFPSSQLFLYNRKYEYEKGLAFSGSILKKNGAEFFKPTDIKFFLSETLLDSAVVKPQVFSINTKDKFKIEGLDFKGEKKLSYLCDNCRVTFDSTFTLPLISPSYLPINWKLVSINSSEINQRSLELPSKSNFQSSILLDEVQVRASKQFDPLNKFSQSTPSFTLKSALVQSYLNTLEEDPIKNIKKQFCKGADNIKIIINNIEEKSIDGISPFNIEKLEIFKGTDAALFNCDCAINVVLKKETDPKAMESIILNGYYSNHN